MPSTASSPAPVIQRVFKLYLATLSAGSLGLVVAILFASPEMQTRYGPHAWLIPLAIFVLCLLWVVGSEAKFYWHRRSYQVRVSVNALFTLTINNDAGDTLVKARREVTNAGRVPIKNLPSLGISANDVSSALQLKMQPPEGKTMKELSRYTYQDGRYRMHVWVHQVPEGLDPGEKITYNYETQVPGSEKDAFTSEGASIEFAVPVEYDEIEWNVTAPAGYKFRLLGGIKVRDEMGNVNWAEATQVAKRYAPEISARDSESVLKWRVSSPLFRHEYECRYRLVQNS